MARWHLEDLAATGDLAADFATSNATIVNWSRRYADFPAPLVSLSTGPVYSRRQVRQWHDGRKWQAGKHKDRIAVET